MVEASESGGGEEDDEKRVDMHLVDDGVLLSGSEKESEESGPASSLK